MKKLTKAAIMFCLMMSIQTASAFDDGGWLTDTITDLKDLMFWVVGALGSIGLLLLAGGALRNSEGVNETSNKFLDWGVLCIIVALVISAVGLIPKIIGIFK